MRILHLLAQLPARTGSGIYFSNIIEGLKAYGHQQKALFARQGDFAFDLLPVCDQCAVDFASQELPFAIAGMSDVMPYESTVYSKLSEQELAMWQQAFSVKLQQIKDEFAPQIIICHHLWYLTALAIDIFPEAVKIGVCHNTDLRQAEKHPQLQSKYAGNIKQLDMVLALSHQQAAEIETVYGYPRQQIEVLGGGFDERIFYPRQKTAKNNIELVFAAKISRSKGIFELVQAFKLLSKQEDNLHLYIVGNAYDENAQHLKQEIAGAANISILPAMPQRQLADFLADKDIFVMPSFYEGLGLMAIECLALGLFVVSSEIEGLITLLGEKVNKSPVIEYVPLPRLQDIDQPLEEDVPQFIKHLADKLLLQITRLQEGVEFPKEIQEELTKHSWRGISAHLQQLLTIYE